MFPQGGQLRYKFTNVVGPYRLKGVRHDQPVVRGFSVNLPPAASDLTPIDRADLDGILGADRYLFARNRAEINRDQGEARIGREFFPFLICLVALILGVENVLSNRFYRQLP